MADNNPANAPKQEFNLDEALLEDMQAPAETQDDADDLEFENLLNSFINGDASSSDQNESASKEGENPLEQIEAEAEQKPENSFRREVAALNLGNDENELALAYANFTNAVRAISLMREILAPDFLFKPNMLLPNYKPSVGKKIVSDASLCWDIMMRAFPEKLSTLKPNSSDEEFLNFAEGLTDQNLQLAIISYVEILIDIENCEISYEEKRLKAQRKRIERALYEEYQARRERKQRFIEEVIKRKFPVDAERLITNYFKTAAKDPSGAFEALVTNPSTYAPIQTNKIKPRFFGLMKVSPKDGIRENHRLGEFLKHLKV